MEVRNVAITQNQQNRSIEDVKCFWEETPWAFIMLYSKFSVNHLVHQILKVPYEKNSHQNFSDAPVTRVYSKSELEVLFSAFKNRRFSKRYLFGAGYKPIVDFIPTKVNDLVGRALGWHWLIEVQK